MTRLTDWFCNAWNTLKNVPGKVGNFISRTELIIHIVVNYTRYILGNPATIDKRINNEISCVDSIT